MVVHASHAALPFPVRNARFSVLIPYLDADGDPLDPTTPDTEVSLDNGAFADCAEEASTASGARGVALMTFSGAETNCATLAVYAGMASGPKATLMTIYPRVLPVLESGTAQAGAAGTITLASGAATYPLVGCIVRTTGGTGGGGTGGANNQARIITAYNTSTKVATVVPNWETTPSSDTTYDILYTEMAINALSGRFVRPTEDERTLDITATGAAGIDWGNVENPTTTVGLTGTTVDLVANAVDAAAIATDAMSELRGSLASGTSDSGSTTTMVDAALTQADDDYWKGCWILFTGGNIAGQCRLITGFTASSDTITFAPATTQAVSTQTYDILPAANVDVRQWLGSTVNALISGRLDVNVQAMANDVITAAAIAANAVDASALAADALAEINAEVVDALATDTYAQPGQGTPSATVSIATALMYLYKFLRNRTVVVDTEVRVYNDDATTIDHRATHSHSGTTYDRGEFATGA